MGGSRPQPARSVQPRRVRSYTWPDARAFPVVHRAAPPDLVNVVLLVAIIVSGAVVRLTNSGLGCADWPNCSATKLVDVSTHHALIEQLNRIFSGAIGIPIALGVLVAYRLGAAGRAIVDSRGSCSACSGPKRCSAASR